MVSLDLFNGIGTHGDMRVKTNDAINTLNASKVDTVAGKGLSTNDYDNVASAKVSTALQPSDVVDALTSTVIDKPLSAAQGKALNDAINTLTVGKVDKIAGKGLSTNDYDNVASAKVSTALQPSDVVDALTSTVVDKPLSAAQGKALNDAINTLNLDHGGLIGLTDDDHAQYLLLSGRGGVAQSITGGLSVDGLNMGSVSYERLNNSLFSGFRSNNLGSGVITTRSTTDTVIDRYGYVKTAAINTALEGSHGWPSYEAHTNKFTHSEEFTHASWFKALGATISADTAIAPDGTITADSFIPVAASPSYLSMGLLPKIGLNTFSIFVASDGSLDEITLLAPAAWFNSGIVQVITYTFSTDSIIQSGANVEISGRELLANNYVRLFITVDAEITAASGLQIRYALTNANGTTDNFKIWGAQLNDDYLKPYIPTVAATVTVPGLTYSLPVYNNVALGKNGEFTALVKLSAGVDGFTGVDRYLFKLPVVNGFIMLYFLGVNNTVQFRFDANIITQVQIPFTPNTPLYIAAMCDGFNVKLNVNGEIATLPVTGIPIINTNDNVSVGNADGVNNWLNGSISHLEFKDFALTDSEVEFWRNSI